MYVCVCVCMCVCIAFAVMNQYSIPTVLGPLSTEDKRTKLNTLFLSTSITYIASYCVFSIPLSWYFNQYILSPVNLNFAHFQFNFCFFFCHFFVFFVENIIYLYTQYVTKTKQKISGFHNDEPNAFYTNLICWLILAFSPLDLLSVYPLNGKPNFSFFLFVFVFVFVFKIHTYTHIHA